MTYEKPYFNGADWVVEVKANGITIERHKFESEYKANQFYKENTDKANTEQPKTKATLGGSENK